ncbi:MAG TPA: hypothetical protein VFV07_11965 [Rhizomicrobium sp.]|nr:hypothetical protein [Rhizomicrobium sp.]
MKRALLTVIAFMLFALAFVALFPLTTASLALHVLDIYYLGGSVDTKARIILLAIGAMAGFGGYRVMRSAVRS